MNHGIYPSKGHRGTKIEKPFTDDLPSSFKVDSSQLLENGKGVYKLRARNDVIHAELNEWAVEAKAKLHTQKHGDRIYYMMPDLGITVNLVNA